MWILASLYFTSSRSPRAGCVGQLRDLDTRIRERNIDKRERGRQADGEVEQVHMVSRDTCTVRMFHVSYGDRDGAFAISPLVPLIHASSLVPSRK